MNTIKRIIQYIQGMFHLNLHLSKMQSMHLLSYTDAIRRGCLDTRDQLSFIVFFLVITSSHGPPKGNRHYLDRVQKLNIMALKMSFAKHVGYKICFSKLHGPLSKATIVYYNNGSAIYHSENLVQHQHAKHIENGYPFCTRKGRKSIGMSSSCAFLLTITIQHIHQGSATFTI